MILRTCTKVNIGLNILRKRPDGYHDLETLFVPYWGMGDVLNVEPAERLSIEIQREGGVDWDPMEDLTVRAWRLLKADFPLLPPVAIRLEKGAPVGAGLGGGSADAAFMLRALNELGGLGLSDSALAGYAAKLGSDCAFFVYCSPMFATGRGEILEPFDIDLSGYDLRVELPLDAATGRPVAVSTREAYSGIVPRNLQDADSQQDAYNRLPQTGQSELPKQQSINDIEITPPLRGGDNGRESADNPSGPRKNCSFGRQLAENPSELSVKREFGRKLPEKPSGLREALKLPVPEWRGIVVNDFEATVCPRHPEITALIDDFYRRGAVYAAMSGSGSAVFGLFAK